MVTQTSASYIRFEVKLSTGMWIEMVIDTSSLSPVERVEFLKMAEAMERAAEEIRQTVING